MFYGTGSGQLTNGQCVTNGDQRCYGRFHHRRSIMPETQYDYLFDGCCRGGPAQSWQDKGSMSKEDCEGLCEADSSCNAIEVNGCLGNPACEGACYLFFGTGAGPITNGACVTSGDQKCFEKPSTSGIQALLRIPVPTAASCSMTTCQDGAPCGDNSHMAVWELQDECSIDPS